MELVLRRCLFKTSFLQGSFNRQSSIVWAQRIISNLSPSERIFLNKELSKVIMQTEQQDKMFNCSDEIVSYQQLRLGKYVFVHKFAYV